MSQYSSTYYIITNVKQLFKLRNVKHRASHCATKMMDSKKDTQLLHNVIKYETVLIKRYEFNAEEGAVHTEICRRDLVTNT
jgi:hypothetical protein